MPIYDTWGAERVTRLSVKETKRFLNISKGIDINNYIATFVWVRYAKSRSTMSLVLIQKRPISLSLYNPLQLCRGKAEVMPS